jgi:hypothetical protein
MKVTSILLREASVAAFQQAFDRLLAGMDATVTYSAVVNPDGSTTVVVFVNTTTSYRDAVTAKLRDVQSSNTDKAALGVSSLTFTGGAAPDTASPTSGVSVGAIAGIISGCVLAVGVVVGVIVVLRRTKASETKPHSLDPAITVELQPKSAYSGL